MEDNGVTCSMSRSGNVWDNAAMESFFSSLKTERTAHKVREESRVSLGWCPLNRQQARVIFSDREERGS
jgi:transposase InsO family protein